MTTLKQPLSPVPTAVKRPPLRVALTLGAALAVGCFLVWIVTVDWVVNLMAGLFLVGTAAVGFLAGRAVYRGFDTGLYHWERVAVSVILGLAVAIALGELTHSHKLIRDYENYSNQGDE